jgi:hypothetical protein
VNVYRLKPVGYTSSSAEFRVYSVHLKASSGSTNEQARLQEAIGIRDSMNAVPPGTHALLTGDFNIYASTEPAFQKFLESQVDNDGRLYDPLNANGTWNNASFAAIHTQCPCLNNCPAGFGFSGGGLDDRFDMFLPTLNWNNGQGYELVANSYRPIGNDGQHYNKDINDAPVIPEGQAYADALVGASDHLPLRIDLQLPARISVAASLAFGTVIVGATASQPLTVGNPAAAPADALDYSFTADAGFGAPGGGFVLAAGGLAPHTILMSTAGSGSKSGQLHIASDAVDSPTTHVGLGGTVLDHAAASLDSGAVQLAALLDLGDHGVGAFADGSVRVHNQGYDALQARLSLSAAAITGPAAARFAIVGGFSPVLLAATGSTYAVHFDDAGAPTDSTYAATLTFTSADEPLPGALGQPPLVVTLRARVTGATDVATGELPRATRLHAPYPNPAGNRGTQVRLDLAQDADVRLEVFDVAGRRVALLASGPLARGVHRREWDGRDEHGKQVGAGVYFIRLAVPGRSPETVRLTWLR